MSHPVEPRRLRHRGTVEAEGFCIGTPLLTLDETRRRVLASWRHGAVVYRIETAAEERVAGTRPGATETGAHEIGTERADGGASTLVLLWPHGNAVSCDDAPGLPLVRIGGVLCGAPLFADEIAALAPSPGAIVLPHAGAAVFLRRESLQTEDPSTWIDLSEFNAVQPTALAHAPAPPEKPPAAATMDPRSELAGIGSDPEARAGVMAALRNRGNPVEPTFLGKLAARAVRGVAKLAAVVGSAGGHGGNPHTTDGRPRRKPRSGPLAAFMQRLQQAARRMLWKSQVGRAFGRAHARYLQHMMDLFERGDVLEALRHAIPLGDGSEERTLPRVAPPGGLNDLQLRMHRSRASGSFHVADDTMATLRARYRAAVTVLESQGRIEEAAYVLADLLGNVQEAVDFLERHGRLELAARLAEARELPPEQIVRLWFRAGDHDRAVAIAKRTGTFAGAVVAAEARGLHDDAHAMRVTWARMLAAAGNNAAAVDVLWPITEERERTRVWMDPLIEDGGPVGARMLARAIALNPPDVDALMRRAFDLVESDDEDESAARHAFAVELSTDVGKGARTLARATVRALMRDVGAGHDPQAAQALRYLIERTGDGALRVDTRITGQGSAARPTLAAMPPIAIELDAADRGATSAVDAVRLRNGRMLLALGDAGVRLIGRDGAVIRHFNQPAGALIPADDDSVVITAARRGDAVRLGRICPAVGTQEHWCEAQLSSWADSFDGLIWIAATKEGVQVIDASAPRFRSLWNWASPNHRANAIARTVDSCSFLMAPIRDADGHSGGWEAWGVQLRTLTLRTRAPIPPHLPTTSEIRRVAATGLTARLVLPSIGDHEAFLRPATATLVIGTKEAFTCSTAPAHVDLPAMNDAWACLTLLEPEGMTCRLFHNTSAGLRAMLTFGGASELGVRLTQDHLIAFDNLGRVLVLDLAHGNVVRNLRVA